MFRSMARASLGRQPLLGAARAELLERGGTFELASVARRAGFSVGALYHHFGSKIGLLAALYEEFYRGLTEAVGDDRLPQTPEWRVRERERTRLFVAYHFDDPLAALLLNRAAPDAEIAALESAYLERITDAARRNIARGQLDSQLDPTIDSGSAAAYIIGGLRHGIAHALRPGDAEPDPDVVTGQLWRLIAATLGLPWASG